MNRLLLIYISLSLLACAQGNNTSSATSATIPTSTKLYCDYFRNGVAEAQRARLTLGNSGSAQLDYYTTPASWGSYCMTYLDQDPILEMTWTLSGSSFQTSLSNPVITTQDGAGNTMAWDCSENPSMRTLFESESVSFPDCSSQ